MLRAFLFICRTIPVFFIAAETVRHIKQDNLDRDLSYN